MNRPLWTDKQLIAAMRANYSASETIQCDSVSTDSRTLAPGALFFALKGPNFDAHDYVAQALSSGAAAAVVERAPAGMPSHSPLFVVNDSLQALQDLASAARARSEAKFVGVTGSVGKTSTKEMLRLACGAGARTYASQGNLNNHIGMPMNLANMPLDTQVAIIEMGMNHAGEIAHLAKIARPHIAMITAVEAVHLEFFESVAAIADAKSEIFQGVEPGGAAVLNGDNAYAAQCAAAANHCGISQIVWFGTAEGCEGRVLASHVTAHGTHVEAEIFGARLNYTLGACGAHWAGVSVSALAVAHLLGHDVKAAAEALSKFHEVQGRGQVAQLTLRNGANIALIDDSYNASPASMQSALLKLSALSATDAAPHRTIAILGDMLELGDTAPQLHAQLAEDCARAKVDVVYTAGRLMESLHQALPRELRGAHTATSMELLELLQTQLRQGDWVLIKGSHGSNMHQLAKALLADAKTDSHPQPKARHAV